MSSRSYSHGSRSSQRSNKSSPLSHSYSTSRSKSLSASRSRSSPRSQSRARSSRRPDYRRAAFLNLRNQRLPPFKLRTELTIGSKRMVKMIGDFVEISHSMFIYHKGMSKEEQKEAIETIKKNGHSEHRCALNGEDNSFEQKTYQGEHLMLIESVFKVKATELQKTWEKKDIRKHDRVGTVRIRETIGNISLTTTYWLKNDLAGFALSAKLRVGMGSTNEDETKLTRRNSDYRRRVEQPNVDEMIWLGETFAADQRTLVLSSDTCLGRDIIHILQEAEEHRQYSLDMRNHLQMTFLEPSFRSPRRQLFLDQSANGSTQPSPGSTGLKSLDSTQFFSCTQSFLAPGEAKNASVQQSPSLSLGQYQSMQEARNRSQSPSVARSPKPITPLFKTFLTPQKKTPPPKTPPRVEISPMMGLGASNTSQPKNTTVEKSTRMHNHQLKLYCDIDGTAYEFIGNITIQAEHGVSLDPRRVLFDSKVLWQHSSEWNPTSFTSSCANMTGSFVNRK